MADENKRDELFVEIAVAEGLLSESQASDLVDTLAKLRDMGLSRSTAQLAREK